MMFLFDLIAVGKLWFCSQKYECDFAVSKFCNEIIFSEIEAEYFYRFLVTCVYQKKYFVLVFLETSIATFEKLFFPYIDHVQFPVLLILLLVANLNS